MPTKRPCVFIGSSTEGLEIARAIQVNLDQACELTIWGQGIFGLGGGTLENLVEKLDDFDFAIFVLTPDDLVTSRGRRQESPRDNVLLELGLQQAAHWYSSRASASFSSSEMHAPHRHWAQSAGLSATLKFAWGHLGL